ncbi:EAL domain-containing protein [Pseudobacteriovorax antillogorgiicola]|uniref:EAL domain, c-di-GMP-specific phosphodiesterase class I (Or its enzymatically inactive variant) n=1 Tax=Pseudobacteriovorax antillogorgiicola TaxID=1513793 RepID=A0A1Y6BC53_9BACT|nr:EAL domain-containing protein [Pseudobacteriovorax antillogorgiicola]TCS58642.1 EAL domain-containing protein (putative c-di-GMP-specific phosphodiesterase class I) [Pseudobacteriovorax antillogorgiicola]SME96516.1 EAL domain, c-di-GMP-specific phosphodiesterase class I (or its enzymatically inactive variant) [Pseudobacteriovorax antillogorgiicola]
MIVIATQDKALAKQLKDDLYEASMDSRIIDVNDKAFIAHFYKQEVTAIIADEEYQTLPSEATIDILNSLARRMPVLVLRGELPHKDMNNSNSHEFNDALTVLAKENYNDILTTASLFSGIVANQGVKARCKSIPFYNSQIPISMLNSFGGLGILTIDASSFNKISVEYGSDVYAKMKEVFHDILFDLWGRPGCFRDSDVICRKSMTSNTYVIFMNRSRDTGALPHPGALERVADRISNSIHNALWDELFAPRTNRRIPSCVESIPLVGVGFFGVLNNPCIDVQEILDSGLEASKQMASSQQKRGRERQRELMQTLIQSEDLLTPYYQGVFNLQNLSKELVDKVHADKSITPLKSHIYGFESLIRVNQEAVQKENNFESGVDSRYLRPDVLFSLAKYTKVALELDQACMKHAAKYAKDLPGTLMINILPRNLYYIERLRTSFERKERLMFEISESEAISNFDLMMKSRDHLEKHHMGIAADDFGKGYSSLERIIRIKPHVIKFDRGMIQNIDKDSVKQAYVKGLVRAAKILNTTILAEGVETWEEAAVLQKMGVELIQGFLLHRPQEVHLILEQIGKKPSKLDTVA